MVRISSINLLSMVKVAGVKVKVVGGGGGFSPIDSWEVQHAGVFISE